MFVGRFARVTDVDAFPMLLGVLHTSRNVTFCIPHANAKSLLIDHTGRKRFPLATRALRQYKRRICSIADYVVILR